MITVALHTAPPEGADQSSNEATYAGYARVAISEEEWRELHRPIVFPECQGRGQIVAYVSRGVDGLIVPGSVRPIGSHAVTVGIIPNVGPATQSTIT